MTERYSEKQGHAIGVSDIRKCEIETLPLSADPQFHIQLISVLLPSSWGGLVGATFLTTSCVRVKKLLRLWPHVRPFLSRIVTGVVYLLCKMSETFVCPTLI